MRNIKVIEKIDTFCTSKYKGGFREHLGASEIGHPCTRYLWYKFRWAAKASFNGAMLRLFQRGHDEEEKLLKYLNGIGCETFSVDETGKQYSFGDLGNHFRGSLDGVAKYVPDFAPDEPVLLEFKTHNLKNFGKLLKLFDKDSLEKAFPQHFAQMQVYMHYFGLKNGLYLAVCKENDALFAKKVPFDGSASKWIEKAKAVIFEPTAPLKISKTSSFFRCVFCTFKNICHNSEVAELNCRTCAFSTPQPEGGWICERKTNYASAEAGVYRNDTPCEDHIYLPEMIGGTEVLQMGEGNKGPFLRLKNIFTDEIIIHGPQFVKSKELGIPSF